MSRSTLEKLVNNIVSKLEFNRYRRLKGDELVEVISTAFSSTERGEPSREFSIKVSGLFEKFTLLGKLESEDIIYLRDNDLDYYLVTDVFEAIFRNMITFKKLSNGALIRINLNLLVKHKLCEPYNKPEIIQLERTKQLSEDLIEDYLYKLEKCEEISVVKEGLVRLLKVMRWM